MSPVSTTNFKEKYMQYKTIAQTSRNVIFGLVEYLTITMKIPKLQIFMDLFPSKILFIGKKISTKIVA